VTAFIVIYWIGAIGTCAYYWFTRGRKAEFIVGRTLGALSFMFWPLFLIYFFMERNRAATRQIETDEAKKRILG
jgi:hypothetical protein